MQSKKNETKLIAALLAALAFGGCGRPEEAAEPELDAAGNAIIAWRTFYFEDGIVGSGWGRLTETPPNVPRTTQTGWTVGNESPNQFALLDVGVEQPERAFGASIYPAPGVGGLQNCFRSENTYSHFTTGQAISMKLAVRAVSSGGSQDGHADIALFRCTDDTCSAGAEEVTLWSLSDVKNLTTSPQTMTGGSYEAATYHAESYYFVCMEWAITGAGTNNNKDVRLVADRENSWIAIPYVQ